jgi:uncharacterized protein (TIGR02145 family)
MRKNLILLFVILLVVNINLVSQTLKTVKIANQVWMAENLNINTEGSSCYNYQDDYCKKYGKLYNWEAAKKVCPSGWRLPTDKDWELLIANSGGEDEAGNRLKWNGSSGFNALLGGLSNNRGFCLVDFCGAYWTADSYDNLRAWYYYFNNKDGLVTKTYFNKNYGFSVRCIKE